MENDVTPIAVHSSMRNVNVQFVVADSEYQQTICALHKVFCLPQNEPQALTA
ncbi:hypothetical protein JCM19238_1876 [Vibrio ponticus]|nr:hypothetical protein JCM19238_1876 [Vibrio ponticus]